MSDIPEGAQVMPEDLRAAYAAIAEYGPGTGAVTIPLDDGRVIMVESRSFDVTGWEDER